MLARHAISDADWDRIKDLLPGREGQTGWIAEDNRRFIDGVLWIAKTSVPWRDLPERFGNWIRFESDSTAGLARVLGKLTSRRYKMPTSNGW